MRPRSVSITLNHFGDVIGFCLGVLSSRLTLRFAHRLVGNLHVVSGVIRDVVGVALGIAPLPVQIEAKTSSGGGRLEDRKLGPI